jgi:unsaturated chondroitin disaccharide hydrolase
VATELASRWTRAGQRVAPAERAVPEGPPDTSAAAIVAVALCKLGRADAAATLTRVLVEEHLDAGRLLDGCFDLDRRLATRHELVWGNFFLLLALAILTGALPAELG